MPGSSFKIAQVTPYSWEEDRETNRFVASLSAALTARGHEVVIVAPTTRLKLVRETRALIKRAANDPSELFERSESGPRVLGIGQSLPFPPAKLGGTVALPIDVTRALEDLFELDCFDFVHVHEPFAPSAASAALRLSQSLNVGTFHQPTERTLSTQVARRFVELFFGRLDARTANNDVTRDLVCGYFPGQYELIGPGADPAPPHAAREPGAPAEIAIAMTEERAALRILLRALRKLPRGLDWRLRVLAAVPNPVVPASLSKRLRERIEFIGSEAISEAELLAGADIAVAASAGVAPSPGYVARLVASGAVPLAASLPAYREALDDGALGLMFEPGNAEALAGQLERLIVDAALCRQLTDAAARQAAQNTWADVAARFETIYERVASRRHDARPEKRGDPSVRKRIAGRPLIDVDLHMHTDHSHDCATPVEVLLETARVQGLGAIAITDHNEVSGAHAAAAIAEDYGVKVIIAEEVKTASQGEVIGLFINEKIERGLTLEQTIAEIRRQDGLVYVPHPFDRMHSVPDYEHLLNVIDDIDAIEVFNPRVAFSAFNEEAARFARKYRIVAGAGSDSHVAQGLGSVRIRMRDFDGPQEFLESLRDADITRSPSSLVYVQALKFLQTKTGLEPKVPSARRAARRSRSQRPV